MQIGAYFLTHLANIYRSSCEISIKINTNTMQEIPYGSKLENNSVRLGYESIFFDYLIITMRRQVVIS